MNRSLILSISLFLLYVSMTCVHIPFSYRKSTLLNSNSPFLMANHKSGSFEQGEYEKNLDRENSEAKLSLFENKDPESGYQVRKENVKIDIYNIPMPQFVRGIYLSNYTANSKSALEKLIAEARENRINTFVVDVQNDMIPREYVDLIKKAGIFPVARVVVFTGGLRTKTPTPDYIQNILSIMDAAAYQGFLEVQLDYIRYADSIEMERLPLSFKYDTINNILKQSREKAASLSVFLSADLFGRVTLNEHDHIGQKLENFSKYMDVIYPMLYPSHYYNDDFRISHPYETVKEGVANSVRRCQNTRIVAYLQGFSWKIDKSGKTMKDYLKAQFQAVEDAGGHGWVIWNAQNSYKESFNAISSYDTSKRKRISKTKSKDQDIL